MRRLDVLFSPADAPLEGLHGMLVFPVDVLRFTSTVLHALAAGARSVRPLDSLFGLRSAASACPDGSCVTAGEEGGTPLPGLDLGNSPAHFTPDIVRDKDLLIATTNGSRLINALQGNGRILPLALLNLSAAARHARAIDGDGVVVCAGWRRRFALEDALVAGAFVVESLRLDPGLELSEAALAARDLLVRGQTPLEDRIRASAAARRLAGLGFAEDVEACLRTDALPVVAVAEGSPRRIVLAEPLPDGFVPPALPAPPAGAGREPDAAAGTAPEAEAAADEPPPPPGDGSGPEKPPSGGSEGEGGGPDATGGGGDGGADGTGGGPPGEGPAEPAGAGDGGDGKKERPLGREDVDAFRMSLGEHLEELRRRVIFSILFALAGFVGVFLFREPVVNFVLGPVTKAFDAIQKERAAETPKDGKEASPGKEGEEEAEARAPVRPRIIAVAPQEIFMSQIKISLVVGIFLASPLIFWQLWLFISAGLYPWERKWVVLFAPATYVCFAGGVLFLYFVVLPLGLKFLLGFGYHPDVLPTTGYSAYVGFFLLLATVMGVVFELPLVMLFLSRLGLVPPRAYRRYRKYILVAIFVCAAVITPPDVITQLLVAAPLIVLYELGIWLGTLVYRKRAPQEEKG